MWRAGEQIELRIIFPIIFFRTLAASAKHIETNTITSPIYLYLFVRLVFVCIRSKSCLFVFAFLASFFDKIFRQSLVLCLYIKMHNDNGFAANVCCIRCLFVTFHLFYRLPAVLHCAQ